MRLEQLAKDCDPTSRARIVIGTMYFPAGTSVNEVARHVMKRQETTSGIWLIQMRVSQPELYDNVQDGCYVNVRDSKHQLEDKQYTAMYYNGPNMFID